MCFFTKGSKIKIATTDIPCYKTVRRSHDGYFSIYQNFDYKCNKEYSGKSKWILFLKWLLNFYIESEGYHSHIDFWCNWDYSGHQSQNVKCIIPKGSLYLVNELNGEYCSSSIIIKKTEL